MPIGKRVVTGMVTSNTGTQQDGVRDILEVLDDTPSMAPNILELTRRLAEYYMCSWGEAIMAALPSGLTPASTVRVELNRWISDDELSAIHRRSPRRAALLTLLREHSTDLSVAYLQQQLQHRSVTDQLDALQRSGLITIRTSVEQQVDASTVKAYDLADYLKESDDALKTVLNDLDKRAPKQSMALAHLYLAYKRGEGPVPASRLLTEAQVSAAVADTLVGKGLVTTHRLIKKQSFDHTSLAWRNEAELTLTTEQQRAVDAVDLTKYGAYLLEGVTGSGKTLVYMRLFERVRQAGKTCLLLVPEIALTPQLIDRFENVFPGQIAQLHSRQGMRERVTTWQNIANGTLPIVIGARSSVFAPLPNLGLVVVDEEHESSYKQEDPAPRYHGRDVAIMRATYEQCPVVLGSATPSLESLYNVELKRYKHLTLSTRTDGAVKPSIQIVSMQDERAQSQQRLTIGPTLAQAIRETVERGDGVILFLNRRGFASQYACADCSHVLSCPNCDVYLTWHKRQNILRCHYCGHSELAPSVCVECGGVEMYDTGIGTQRVEEDLLAVLSPDIPRTPKGMQMVVARMDSDTMKSKNAHRALLERFANGTVDVVIGTQMVAKGLDIPRVTLVGVVLADQTLNQNDFRAAERTVQLLTQVAGRSGRTAERPGRVIIQTFAPTHPAIRAVAEESLTAWQHAELEHRRDTHFPPTHRCIVIEVSGQQESDVEHVAQVLDKLIPSELPFIQRNPPMAPSIAWIRNRHRRIIVIRNSKQLDSGGGKVRAVLDAALRSYYEQYARSSVRVTVDVDSLGMV